MFVEVLEILMKISFPGKHMPARRKLCTKIYLCIQKYTGKGLTKTDTKADEHNLNSNSNN